MFLHLKLDLNTEVILLLLIKKFHQQFKTLSSHTVMYFHEIKQTIYTRTSAGSGG